MQQRRSPYSPDRTSTGPVLVRSGFAWGWSCFNRGAPPSAFLGISRVADPQGSPRGPQIVTLSFLNRFAWGWSCFNRDAFPSVFLGISRVADPQGSPRDPQIVTLSFLNHFAWGWSCFNRDALPSAFLGF